MPRPQWYLFSGDLCNIFAMTSDRLLGILLSNSCKLGGCFVCGSENEYISLVGVSKDSIACRCCVSKQKDLVNLVVPYVRGGDEQQMFLQRDIFQLTTGKTRFLFFKHEEVRKAKKKKKQQLKTCMFLWNDVPRE